MTIRDNSVQQINTALLALENKIGKASTPKELEELKQEISKLSKSFVGEGVVEGRTYNINITGNAATASIANTATTASSASTAETATNATNATNALYATRADKLTTPRTISLSGDATGSAQFDGSSNVDIDVTVTLAESVFDIVHPIGEVYVQYPNQKTPNELWGQVSTWTEITSEYAGLFFRAAGGNAAAFGTEQADAIKTHTTGSESRSHTHTTTSQSTSTTSTNGEHSHTVANYTGQVGWKETSPWSYLSNNADSYVTGYNPATSTNGSHSHTLEHTHGTGNASQDHTHTYTGDVETRPINTAIKLWKRTA